MNKKKPDIKAIFLIIFISSVIGFFYNSYNSPGLPIIKSPLSVEWVSDSSLTDSAHVTNAQKNIPTEKETTHVALEEIKSKPGETIMAKTDEPAQLKAITISQAFRLYKMHNSTFIDARDKWEYADGHIKGALNIAEYSFDKNTSRVSSLNKNGILVTYCGEGDCSMSEKLAAKLSNMGFKKVFIFKDGFEAWLKAGYDTEKSELE